MCLLVWKIVPVLKDSKWEALAIIDIGLQFFIHIYVVLDGKF